MLCGEVFVGNAVAGSFAQHMQAVIVGQCLGKGGLGNGPPQP